MQTTLSKDPLPEAIAKLASLATMPVAAPMPMRPGRRDARGSPAADGRRRRALRAARPALEAAAAQREAAVPRGLGPRPEGQGGPRRARRRDDRRRRLAGDDDRRDQEGALPDGGEPGRAGGQGDDHLHRARPPRQLGALRRDRAAPARGARLPRGGLPAAQGPAEERARRGPAHQQRGGARQGAPAGARLPGHALRPPGARDAWPGSRRSRSTT